MTLRACAILAVLSLSFCHATAADLTHVSADAAGAEGVIDLFEAVEEGSVDLKFIAKSDRRARVILANKTNRQLQLDLPDVFAGVPVLAQFGGGGGGLGGGGGGLGGGGGGQQSVGGGGLGGGGGGLGGGGGGAFSIPPEKTAKIDVPVLCLDHGKKDPSSSKPYELVAAEDHIDRPAVIELLKAFGTGKLDHGAAQAAVWALNNDISWQALAAKRAGTARDYNRPPYFSRAEIEVGMAYAKEAVRRAELAAASRAENPAESMATPTEEETGEEDAPKEDAPKEEASEQESDSEETDAEAEESADAVVG